MANILIVDDDPAVVARHTAALEADGHSVSTADTAPEALDAVHSHPPDLVVLEGILGDRPVGFDLARALAVEAPTLPLVMVTRADDVLADADRAAQDRDGGWLPVQRYLEKPVMPDVLAYEVGHLLADAEDQA